MSRPDRPPATQQRRRPHPGPATRRRGHRPAAGRVDPHRPDLHPARQTTSSPGPAHRVPTDTAGPGPGSRADPRLGHDQRPTGPRARTTGRLDLEKGGHRPDHRPGHRGHRQDLPGARGHGRTGQGQRRHLPGARMPDPHRPHRPGPHQGVETPGRRRADHRDQPGRPSPRPPQPQKPPAWTATKQPTGR